MFKTLVLDKISLTDFEKQIVNDRHFIDAKQQITAKVYELFGKLAPVYAAAFEQSLYSTAAGNPKISKGENYLGLPYVMFDYPALFGKTDVFAIRSFFWWGNFYSITLQLSGSFKIKYEENIKNALVGNAYTGWHISHSEEQWQHHFRDTLDVQDDGYNKQIFAGKTFIKLAKKIPLSEWDGSFRFFVDSFNEIISMLTYQAPMR